MAWKREHRRSWGCGALGGGGGCGERKGQYNIMLKGFSMSKQNT